ncbi:phasin family protein [Undibacterium sp. TJN19]|uniref:phasin family protein n=1 Tax=Undibacterium sp. TJN19 TaxID=3413055 RepID=UPI003BF0D040
MSLLPEQLSSAAQTQIATQIAVFRAFGQSAFGGLEKLLALNFNVAKQSFENVNTVTHELLTIKEPQQLLKLTAAQSQPQIEKILSYGRELASIGSDTRSELWQAISANTLSAPTAPVKAIARIEATKPTLTQVAVLAVKAAPAAATVKPAVKKTVAAKPLSSPGKQLTLLAEPETKPGKAVNKQKVPTKAVATPKPEIKPVTSKTKKTVVAVTKTETPITIASPVTAVAAPGITVPAAAITTDKKAAAPIAATTAATAAATTPVATAAAKKPAAKPVAKVATTETVESVSAKAPVVAEKKSAVKFPSAAIAKAKSGAPAFPNTNAQPGYKAKSSAATGAKKRVRQ